MDNVAVNKISFDYNGKHYTLEYTLDTIKQMESAGFNINEIGDKPAIRIEQLWTGAFLAHNRKTSQNVIKEMYYNMKNREVLVTKLAEMYSNALANLMPDGDEGNIEWTATV